MVDFSGITRNAEGVRLINQRSGKNRDAAQKEWEQYKATHRGDWSENEISGPEWNDIAGYFDKALASLTGDAEKAYQQGKRRSLTDIAMQSVNSGMANTLNMPAATIAYDEANRPTFNTMLGQQKAGILTGLGRTAADIYGADLGSRTSLQTARLGANVSMRNATLAANTAANTAAAQQELQRYIAGLNNQAVNREMSLRAHGLWNQS